MMHLNPIQLTLLDGVDTNEFGFIRFFTVMDLLTLGEDEYYKLISSVAQSTIALGVGDEFKTLDLLFVVCDNGSRLSTEDGDELLNSLIRLLCIVYDIEVDEIHVDYNRFTIKLLQNKKLIEINRNNFDDFCSIILQSNMAKKTEKKKEIKFKGQDLDAQAQYLEFKKQQALKEKKNELSMAVIINIVLVKLKLFNDKKSVLTMTIYNVLFAYISSMAEEDFDISMKWRMAGASKDEVKVEHYSQKIKEMFKEEE